jgi:hypothetical protein
VTIHRDDFASAVFGLGRGTAAIQFATLSAGLNGLSASDFLIVV